MLGEGEAHISVLIVRQRDGNEVEMRTVCYVGEKFKLRF
jgi:hypothetical protein